MLIGLTGRKRSGKSTAARYLGKHYRFTELAFADPLKDAALALDPIVDVDPDFDYMGAIAGIDVKRLSELVAAVGWERAKDAVPEVRRILQRLGTEVVRNHVKDSAWTDLMFDRIEEIRDTDHKVPFRIEDPEDVDLTPIVVTDVRFENEAELITKLGGSIVEINRLGHAPEIDHASEAGVRWDYQLDNVTGKPEILQTELDRLVRWMS